MKKRKKIVGTVFLALRYRTDGPDNPTTEATVFGDNKADRPHG